MVILVGADLLGDINLHVAKHLPNGLYCGYDDNSRENNIFRKNKFVYCSNNENYKNR